MDLVTRLPRSSSEYDAIWVIVDRSTKFAHFLAIREDFKIERLARIYINEIVARYYVPVSIISDRDGRFSSLFWHVLWTLEGVGILTFRWLSFYNNSYHKSSKYVTFEALYMRKCRSPVIWAEVEPIEIVDRQVKKLKRSWIPIVMVRWDSRRGAEFTWEREVNSKPCTRTFSPPHRLLLLSVEL
nr:putative reverse transcriptase domain-containing protein [Tanacetum cinerariifolium]